MREITKVKFFIQSKYYCKSIYKVYSVNSEAWTQKLWGGSWDLLLRRENFQPSFKEWMRIWLVNKKGNTFMKENKEHVRMSQELLVRCTLQLLGLLSCIQRMTQWDEPLKRNTLTAVWRLKARGKGRRSRRMRDQHRVSRLCKHKAVRLHWRTLHSTAGLAEKRNSLFAYFHQWEYISFFMERIYSGSIGGSGPDL